MEEERLRLAKHIFEGDNDKARELLELIDLSIQFTSKMPDVKMCLPEEECLNCVNGDTCILNFPDSILKCTGKCENAVYLAENLDL